MKDVIAAAGPCTLTPNPADPFTLMVRSVISQQISTKAAQSIFGRLAGAVGNPVSMPKLAKMAEADFKLCGVSGPKQRTLRAIVEHVKANPDLLPGIEEREDELIHEQLTQIKGIGPWSVDMLLIFGFARLNVLPVGDYGVRAAAKNLFRLRELPNAKKLTALAKPWEPYRSIASWYLWRSLDLKPKK